jgi:histidine ammonia-lyase
VKVIIDSVADLTLETFRRIVVAGEAAAVPAPARPLQQLLAVPSPGTAGGAESPKLGRLIAAVAFACLGEILGGTATDADYMASALAALPEQAAALRATTLQPAALADLLAEAGRTARPDLHQHQTLAWQRRLQAAFAVDAAVTAPARLDLAGQVFALAAEGIAAPLDAYDDALAPIWGGDPYDEAALAAVRRCLEGTPTETRRPYHAPVSFRILPKVLGQALRAVAGTRQAAQAMLAPALPGATGTTHTGQPPAGQYGWLASRLDMLTASWADLCTLAERQTARLLDGRSSLLPHQLAKPGVRGPHPAEWAAVQARVAEEARGAARSTFLPISSNGDGAPSAVTAALFAVQPERATARCLSASMACLATVASQALWVSGRHAPPRLRGLLSVVRQHCPPASTGQPPRVSRLYRLIEVIDEAAAAAQTDLALPAAPRHQPRDTRR